MASEPGWTPGPGLCWCGLTLSRNPHPDAGRPDESGAAVGYVYECIPCLVKTRNRVGAAWRAAQSENERLRALLVEARAEIDRWGHGDMHYGPMPRDPRVLAMLAKIDATLGAGAESSGSDNDATTAEAVIDR